MRYKAACLKWPLAPHGQVELSWTWIDISCVEPTLQSPTLSLRTIVMLPRCEWAWQEGTCMLSLSSPNTIERNVVSQKKEKRVTLYIVCCNNAAGMPPQSRQPDQSSSSKSLHVEEIKEQLARSSFLKL
eukprot:4451122-Amphidinium_carterae.2